MTGERDVGEDFSRQLSNLVNALMHLAPSRNYVTQFLYIVKINGSVDYRILEEAYADIVKDEYTREAFAKAFGVSFTDRISLDSGKYGWFLTEFIDKLFLLFEDPEFRSCARLRPAKAEEEKLEGREADSGNQGAVGKPQDTTKREGGGGPLAGEEQGQEA